jgi:twitching motility two-component system response regulator PilH
VQKQGGNIPVAIKKILVVDDSATVRRFMLDLLLKGGYEVIMASTGDEAVSKSQAEMPDLVLMDVVMPGMNGFQATRAITRHESTQHIPVLMVTGKDMETDRIWGLRQGATEFISKPVHAGELLAKIAALSNRADRAD